MRVAESENRERGRSMKVGIFGSGEVAQSLGAGFIKHGHTIVMGTRDPEFPHARLVKAFNSVGSDLMVNPQLSGGPPASSSRWPSSGASRVSSATSGHTLSRFCDSDRLTCVRPVVVGANWA